MKKKAGIAGENADLGHEWGGHSGTSLFYTLLMPFCVRSILSEDYASVLTSNPNDAVVKDIFLVYKY